MRSARANYRIKVSWEFMLNSLPLLPLRVGGFIFPGQTKTIGIGRPNTIATARKTFAERKTIAMVGIRDDKVEQPTCEDLYPVGVFCKIKSLHEDDRGILLAFTGRNRIQIKSVVLGADDIPLVSAQQLYDKNSLGASLSSAVAELLETTAVLAERVALPEPMVELIKSSIPWDRSEELASSLLPGTIVHYLSYGQHGSAFSRDSLQNILVCSSDSERIQYLNSLLKEEISQRRISPDYWHSVTESLNHDFFQSIKVFETHYVPGRQGADSGKTGSVSDLQKTLTAAHSRNRPEAINADSWTFSDPDELLEIGSVYGDPAAQFYREKKHKK